MQYTYYIVYTNIFFYGQNIELIIVDTIICDISLLLFYMDSTSLQHLLPLVFGDEYLFRKILKSKSIEDNLNIRGVCKLFSNIHPYSKITPIINKFMQTLHKSPINYNIIYNHLNFEIERPSDIISIYNNLYLLRYINYNGRQKRKYDNSLYKDSYLPKILINVI